MLLKASDDSKTRGRTPTFGCVDLPALAAVWNLGPRLAPLVVPILARCCSADRWCRIERLHPVVSVALVVSLGLQQPRQRCRLLGKLPRIGFLKLPQVVKLPANAGQLLRQPAGAESDAPPIFFFTTV
jgi:hypothetical protein